MNHTTMKATAVISEAWRSITSGAARLAPAVLALALTAAGMGVALEMGLKIVEIFCGAEAADKLKHGILAD